MCGFIEHLIYLDEVLMMQNSFGVIWISFKRGLDSLGNPIIVAEDVVLRF